MSLKKPIEIEFLKTKPDTSLKSQFANVSSNLIPEETKMEENEANNQLLKQMEFYLGDSNLRNDKFLYNLIRQNEKGFIDLTIFLNFNKVKKILAEKLSLDEKLSGLKEVIKASKLLKLNKAQTKVRRRVPFNTQTPKNDNKVVYVEKFPEKTSHELLARIFSKAGEVLHVSLPKYSETHTPKGFAFIEFKTEEAAIQAVEKYNNCIPAEFLQEESNGKLAPLKVIPKIKWLEMKQEFKNLKQRLLDLAGDKAEASSHLAEAERIKEEEEFVERKVEKKEGSLVRLLNLDNQTTKQDILVALRHFCEPAYIDYKRGSNTCVIRFENKTLRDAFCERCSVQPMKILKQIISPEKIEGAEETAYWDEISKRKNAFREYLYNKKHQNPSKKIKK